MWSQIETTAHRDRSLTEHRLMNGWCRRRRCCSLRLVDDCAYNDDGSSAKQKYTQPMLHNSSITGRTEHKNYCRVTGFRFILLTYCGWLYACLSACLSVYLSISHVWLKWRIVIACKCRFSFVFKWNNERTHLFLCIFKFCSLFKVLKRNEKKSNERKTISKIVIMVSLKWQRKKIVKNDRYKLLCRVE